MTERSEIDASSGKVVKSKKKKRKKKKKKKGNAGSVADHRRKWGTNKI